MSASSIVIILMIIFCGHSLALKETQDGTLNFEIHRQKTPSQQLMNYGHYLNSISHGVKPKPPRDNDSIALYRFLNDEFYGKIVVGHPGQTLNVAFDTTWSYSWVISNKCSSIKAIGCYFHNKYDHSKSSEYKPDGRRFSMDLGKYNLTGFYSYENISIAHSNVTGQSFIEMVDVPYEYIFTKADGVMGLGLKTDENYTPFFYTLLNQNKIKNPIFSIYLNRDRQSNRGGNVMLGFIDEKHIHKTEPKVPDNFTYLPVENFAFWQFQMDSIIVDMQKTDPVIVCKGGCKAVADTSSNSIIGPKDEIDKIHDAINAREFLLHRYTVDCDTVNKLPKIEFVLSGQNFTLGGEDYTVKMSYHSITICLSAFMPNYIPQDEGRWFLGAAFLAQYYSVYDIQAKKIGFVKAN